MFRKLYDWTLSWARSRHAPAALGTISFVESSVFPIPADVLFVPMCAAQPEKAMSYAFLASVTSVLGGIFGWFVGHYGAEVIVRPLMEFYGEVDKFDSLQAYVNGNTWIILLLLVTSGLAHLPPMKVVTLLSGVVGFNLGLFVLSAIVARSARFYGLAWLMRRYGAAILGFIERRLTLIAGGVIVIGLAAWYLLKAHG
ncbi:MAG: DedA family protein [Defluviimonas sp.]|uniref:YqaA family protein n=1 Tax=Albidovulum sp. TaxID=1872424 RepID=UPI001D912890|nr:DedA family protein [Paracoccaceae bacterium]MCC0065035.1 DedA family protein [Defluviimonas sp.]